MPLNIERKRVYELPAATDGKRVLVDRLWPRGVSKAAAQIDVWLKAVAPSSALRTWFHHEGGTFDAFRVLYLQELQEDATAHAALLELRDMAAAEHVTLVYGAKDPQNNHVTVIMEALKSLEG